MARAHARILASIWAEDDWKQLSAAAQRVFFLVLSQPKLSLCGAIDFLPARWAGLAADTRADEIIDAVLELEQHRFLIVDTATDELAIRSFTRHDLPEKLNVNQLKGVWSAWSSISSRHIRRHLAAEFPESFFHDSRVVPPVDAVDARTTSPQVDTVETDDVDPVATEPAPPVATARPDDPSPLAVPTIRNTPAVARSSSERAPTPDDEPPASGLAGIDIMGFAAKILATAETARRNSCGELTNPQGYLRSRVEPIRREHEAAWARLLDECPDATPDQLARHVTDANLTAEPAPRATTGPLHLPGTGPCPTYVAALSDDSVRAPMPAFVRGALR